MRDQHGATLRSLPILFFASITRKSNRSPLSHGQLTREVFDVTPPFPGSAFSPFKEDFRFLPSRKRSDRLCQPRHRFFHCIGTPPPPFPGGFALVPQQHDSSSDLSRAESIFFPLVRSLLPPQVVRISPLYRESSSVLPRSPNLHPGHLNGFPPLLS